MQSSDIARRIGQLAALLALQVLVFNHVHLGMYAIPLTAVLFVAWAPLGTPTIRLMVVSFAFGLVQDIFAGTLGMSAAALTAAAFVQHPLLRALAPADALDTLRASYVSIGIFRHLTYMFILFLLYHVVFFVLEDFNFTDIEGLTLSFLTSLLVSYLLGLLLDYVRGERL